MSKSKSTQWFSAWQGHLLSCSGQLKTYAKSTSGSSQCVRWTRCTLIVMLQYQHHVHCTWRLRELETYFGACIYFGILNCVSLLNLHFPCWQRMSLVFLNWSFFWCPWSSWNERSAMKSKPGGGLDSIHGRWRVAGSSSSTTTSTTWLNTWEMSGVRTDNLSPNRIVQGLKLI